MKIIFLCKRRPMGRDLLEDPYGRFFHLPRLLSARGHRVYTALLSYRRDASAELHRNGIHWSSHSLYQGCGLKYLSALQKWIKQVRPDWIVGFSDTYYGILAQVMAERFAVKSAIDAYDNFESYIPWCAPLHAWWRKAVSGATVVTAAGPQLAGLLGGLRPDGKAHIVPMAADPDRFTPLSKRECRERMGLPLDQKIIGYCGSIFRNRGIHRLFDALHTVVRDEPNTMIVVTGRKQKGLRLPPHIKWLGYLPNDRVPLIINSLDVFLVINELSTFGNYSYPVKLYEAMSCKVPVVAADTSPIRWILGDRSRFLARTGDGADFARKVGSLLSAGRVDYGEQNSWEQSCSAFEEALRNHG
jgi:glycosyltransferase involved in cell wall biosynthesis